MLTPVGQGGSLARGGGPMISTCQTAVRLQHLSGVFAEVMVEWNKILKFMNFTFLV